MENEKPRLPVTIKLISVNKLSAKSKYNVNSKSRTSARTTGEITRVYVMAHTYAKKAYNGKTSVLPENYSSVVVVDKYCIKDTALL
jgi:glucan biosynthesis protein